MDNHQTPDYGPYGWYGAPAQARTADAATLPQPEAPMARFRRYAAAGVLAIAMVAGGSAVVLAASPDASTSPAPRATSGQDGTTGSSGTADDGSAAPRSGHPCPNDGSNSDSSSDTSTDASNV